MTATAMQPFDASPVQPPPPTTRRASVAIAVAPVAVLLAFTLVIAGVIEAAIGFAVFIVCTCWVVHELHRYQQQIDLCSEPPEATHSVHGLR